MRRHASGVKPWADLRERRVATMSAWKTGRVNLPCRCSESPIRAACISTSKRTTSKPRCNVWKHWGLAGSNGSNGTAGGGSWRLQRGIVSVSRFPNEARSARTRMSGIGSLRSSLSALSRSPRVRRSARSAGCARKTAHYRTDSTVRVGRRHRARGVERRQLFGREGPADAPIFSLSCRSSRSRCLTRYRNRPCDTERRESRERHVSRTGRARRRRECTRSIPRSAHTRRSASQHHSTARRTAAGVAQCRLSLARTRGGCARGRPQSWWTGREIELGGQKRLTPERSRTTPGGSRSSPR
jgi:hypothetical protein